jgi:dihydroorotate dehydrogenase electron transfer subunit
VKQVTATVISNEQLVNGVLRYPRNELGHYLLWLHSPALAEGAKPGQFVMIRCGDRCVLPRPFSIHQVDTGRIAIYYTVWEDGKGTAWLSQLQADDVVELFGPLGNWFETQPNFDNFLLVAAGMGIAPLYFLAQRQLELGCSVTLLYGTRTEHRYPENLLVPGVKLIAATENGSVGRKGMVTELLPEFATGADQVFTCGPTAMYRDMALRKKELGLEGKSVQVSLETRMGCGLGVCYSCTVRTRHGLKQVCQDGPVFDLDDIIWDELMPS